MSDEKIRGPRGGRTTVSADGSRIRKTFWVRPDEDYALRKDAFERRTSEAAIVREVIRKHFGLGDPDED